MNRELWKTLWIMWITICSRNYYTILRKPSFTDFEKNKIEDIRGGYTKKGRKIRLFLKFCVDFQQMKMEVNGKICNCIFVRFST